MKKAACKRQRPIYGTLMHTLGQGTPYLVERQKDNFEDNFSFLHTHIICHFSSKSGFKLAGKAAVSRPLRAGPSEESDQPAVIESMSVA